MLGCIEQRLGDDESISPASLLNYTREEAVAVGDLNPAQLCFLFRVEQAFYETHPDSCFVRRKS